MTIPQSLALALQIGLGVVFALSAAPKLRHPGAFRRDVAAYEIVPPRAAGALAPAVAALEAALAVALLLGYHPGVAAAVGTVLFGCFAVGVGVNLRRGRDIACGCFGNAGERISGTTAVRLGLLAAAALASVAVRPLVSGGDLGLLSAGSGGVRAVDLVSTAMVSAFVLVLGNWALSWPQLRLLIAGRAGQEG